MSNPYIKHQDLKYLLTCLHFHVLMSWHVDIEFRQIYWFHARRIFVFKLSKNIYIYTYIYISLIWMPWIHLLIVDWSANRTVDDDILIRIIRIAWSASPDDTQFNIYIYISCSFWCEWSVTFGEMEMVICLSGLNKTKNDVRVFLRALRFCTMLETI